MALITSSQKSNYAVAQAIFLSGKGVNWYSSRGCCIVKNVVRHLTVMGNNPAYAKRHDVPCFIGAQADEWFGVISGAILNPVTGKPYYK
jgi:hypothetical protein